MSKKKEKFRDIWVNQTTLGRTFNMSAVAIGKKLKELELRQADGKPTEKALSEGYCTSTPLQDGTLFLLWHKGKVKQLLQGAGLQQLSEKEIRCKEIAEAIMEAERLDNEGEDKLAYMLYDDIRSEIKDDNIPIINRFLKEMGSKQQIDKSDE